MAILIKHPINAGTIIFQIRRCTPDILALRKQKKKLELEKQQQQQQQQLTQPQPQTQQQHPSTNSQTMQRMQTIHSQPNLLSNNQANELNTSKLPYLIELNHDGYELQSPRIIQIKSDFYEIGNDKQLAHSTNYIYLDSNLPGIEKKHCALKKSPDNLQLLLVPFAETYINERLIKEPTQLFNSYFIRIGKFALFRLENPNEITNMVIANNGMSNNKQPVNQVQQANNLAVQSNGNQMNGLMNGQMINGSNVMNAVSISNGTGINGQTNTTVIPPNYGTLFETTTVDAKQVPIPVVVQSAANQAGNNATLGKPSEGLPGLLEFSDEGEDALLESICTMNQSNWQFKLAPVYTMYMMLRFRLSQKYKSEITFNEKLVSTSLLIHKMVNFIKEAVDSHHFDKYVLPYWLANSSELLYFLKQDVHLSQISYDAQELLADYVQIAFKYLVNIMQQQLDTVLIAFFDQSDHVEEVNINDESISELNTNRPTLKHVIQVLNETMNLLRGCRVNAALTIQLFSQLFHYVSMWLFNVLVKEKQSGLCTKYWGEKLTRRINKIQMWAEKQGLELAADCHLSRIIQAAFLLQAPKHDVMDLSIISSNCFALNSLQIDFLLSNYILAPNEPQLCVQLCNNLISIAENTADEVLKQDNRAIQLEEEADLQLPFLLPEDGHSSELVKGLPAGLLDFLETLQNAGHCWLWQNTQGPGSWKKFMMNKDSNQVPQQQQQQQQPQPPQQTPASQSQTQMQIPMVQQSHSQHSLVAQQAPPVQIPIQHTQQSQAPVQKKLESQRSIEQLQIPPTQSMPLHSQSAIFNGPPPMKPPHQVVNNNLNNEIMTGTHEETPVVSRQMNKSSEQLYQNNQNKPTPTSIQQQSSVPQPASRSAITPTPTSFIAPATQSPVVVKVRLAKKNNGLGLSIVAARGNNQMSTGIYIRSVVQGGAADDDGQLTAGDQLLAVDEHSLVNVTQERAAELMSKSGPIVMLTVAKKAATFHGLNALLNKSPLPQQQQQQAQLSQMPITTSMPQLNNQAALPNMSTQHQQQINQTSQGAHYPSSTLPRNHHHFSNSNGNQEVINGYVQQDVPPSNGVASRVQPHQPIEYRTRSMSQEILKSNVTSNQSPIKESKPMITNGQMIPQLQQQQQYNRCLPNEQQRFGSERPVSMHQVNMNQYISSNTNGHQQMIVRNLPNDIVPRFGSERPSSSNSMNNNLNSMNRFNSHLTNQPKPLDRMRQASLSELDEINYQNGRAQPVSNDRIDELYGKVNKPASNMMINQQQNQQQHFKTLQPSKINNNGPNNIQFQLQQQQQQQQQQHQPMGIQDTQRTKSVGQLYEQIWSNNQQNEQQNGHTYLQEDQMVNGYQKQLQQSQMQPLVNNNANLRKQDSTDATSKTTSRSNIRVIPISRGEPEQSRNYVNQVVNDSNMAQQRPPPPLVMNKPIIANKPTNIMTQSLSRLPTNGLPHQHTGTEQISTSMAKIKLVQNWEKEQAMRQHEDEKFRLNLLNQRIEMLNQLESKQYRTVEEENKLNKLRTEIEFDKRVLDTLNNQTASDEANDENDVSDYSPEVRERLASQMRDELRMRRSSKDLSEEEHLKDTTNKSNNSTKVGNDGSILKRYEEMDRLQEMKREESRLKKYVDFNVRNEQQQQHQNGQHFNGVTENGHQMTNGNYQNETQAYHHNPYQYQQQQQQQHQQQLQQTPTRPQKHVQFMNEAEVMQMSQDQHSHHDEEDESRSNASSTPPPLPPSQPPAPQQQQQPQQGKRVMFSETSNFLEFDRHEINAPDTPCVIGANEVYVDQRLKMKQQQQQEQLQQPAVEGEKLTFREKMRLFAKQSGEMTPDADNRLKVSKKQREIETKFIK